MATSDSPAGQDTSAQTDRTLATLERLEAANKGVHWLDKMFIASLWFAVVPLTIETVWKIGSALIPLIRQCLC